MKNGFDDKGMGGTQGNATILRAAAEMATEGKCAPSKTCRVSTRTGAPLALFRPDRPDVQTDQIRDFTGR